MLEQQLTKLTDDVIGCVLYPDGSFRRRNAGWGIHGYYYTGNADKVKAIDDFILTKDGYANKGTAVTTVVPAFFLDAFGCVEGHNQTNNTGELLGMLRALEILILKPMPAMVLCDSKYVLDNLANNVHHWRAHNWVTNKGNGEPVKNKELWDLLETTYLKAKELNPKLTLQWIKGHSKDRGNDLADGNAKIGSSGITEQVFIVNTVEDYTKESIATETDPLVTKTRMLFNIGAQRELEPTYYCYGLGSSNNYGHKQTDSKMDKNRKTDLLLGKRISDAFFSVVKLNEPDVFLDSLIARHERVFARDILELAVARLDNAYKRENTQRVGNQGDVGFARDYELRGMMSPADDLLTKTLTPPRLALDSVGVFVTLQRHLEEFVEGANIPHQTRIDLTASWYERVGKSEAHMKTKLKGHITNNLPSLDMNIEIEGKPVVIKLIFGVDIPVRNTLSKLAAFNPKVTLLINHSGASFSYETIIQTDTGCAIYQSPYRQFVVPLPRG